MKNFSIKDQFRVFCTALMFLTRIPVPKNIDHSHAMLQRSARYFSWVGIVVGTIGGAVFFLSARVFSSPLAIAFSMLATILTTGAFHEDGFADCCDAFGGGWTKEKILAIMKDSRLGTYGVTGLMGILCFKFLLLQEFCSRLAPLPVAGIIIAAHSSSRLMPVFIMQQYEYVQDTDLSKSKPLANRKLTMPEIMVALTGGLVACAFLPTVYWLAFVLVLPAAGLTGRYYKKWIGGYTGDCLGATQQLSEIIFYAGVLLIAQYL